MANSEKIRIHWPILILGIVVAVILLCILFFFQVKETEYAFVLRLGEPVIEKQQEEQVRIYDPGLHFKWPFIDEVWRYDNRLHTYSLERGRVEQVQTADEYTIIVSTFLFWRVGDPYTFYNALETVQNAERKLDEIVRNARHNVLGRHKLTELINVKTEKLSLREIEEEMLESVQSTAMEDYGIKVSYLGLNHIGFPEEVSKQVFARMKQERRRQSSKYRAQGKRDAKEIRADAELEAQKIITEAEAEATKIRGEGDRAAAKAFRVFRKNPELASFLRRLEALRNTLDEETSVILNTQTPPYDLFQPDATDITSEKERAPKTGKGEKNNKSSSDKTSGAEDE